MGDNKMQEVTFSQKIHLLVPEALHGQVKQAAFDEGQTISEFLRGAVRDKLRAVKAPAEQAAGAGD